MASLRTVYPFGDGGHPYWHLLPILDPEDRMRWRAKQKIWLARYGRQSWFAFDEHSVDELDEAYEALVELLRGEGALSSAVEDG